jgi:L-rhamnose mutarotase
MKMYCLALDLKDPALIEEFKRHHQPDIIWHKVMENIRSHGVVTEGFLFGTRMVMILRTTDDFSFQQKVALDKVNSPYRRRKSSCPDFRRRSRSRKWVLMEKIFEA